MAKDEFDFSEMFKPNPYQPSNQDSESEPDNNSPPPKPDIDSVPVKPPVKQAEEKPVIKTEPVNDGNIGEKNVQKPVPKKEFNQARYNRNLGLADKVNYKSFGKTFTHSNDKYKFNKDSKSKRVEVVAGLVEGAKQYLSDIRNEDIKGMTDTQFITYLLLSVFPNQISAGFAEAMVSEKPSYEKVEDVIKEDIYESDSEMSFKDVVDTLEDMQRDIQRIDENQIREQNDLNEFLPAIMYGIIYTTMKDMDLIKNLATDDYEGYLSKETDVIKNIPAMLRAGSGLKQSLDTRKQNARRKSQKPY